MALQLIHVEDVFVKVETTEGTDAVPTGADAIQLIGPATLAVGAEIENPRPDLQNQLLDDAAPNAPAAKFCELTLKFQVRGLGSAYATTSVPEAHAVLQAHGLLAAFAASAWSYDTASTALKTVTAYCFHGLNDGTFVKHALVAGRGSTLTIDFIAGKAVEMTSVIRGLFVTPSDTSNITPTYQTALPPLFAGASSWTLNSVTPTVRKASVTIPSPLVPRLSGNATDALAGYQQASRSPAFTADFEAAKIADYDAFSEWKNASNRALAIALGSAANNKMTIAADKATLMKAPVYRDESGLWLFGVEGVLTPEGTNRCKITFGP